MPEAGEYVCEVVWHVISVLHWLNADLTAELRMKTRVSSRGIAALLLQQHPGKPRTWMPVESWGHCLKPLEMMESRILLELKAPHEGTWKMGEFTVFSQQFTMRITTELWALLKVVPKAHPELQAMLIDIQHYKPTWAIGGTSAVPEELDFPSSTTGKWDEPDDPVDLDNMHSAESALGKVSFPPKARFVLGKVVHVQFVSGSQEGHATGRFVILDMDGKEAVQAGQYYGPGWTNNETESFAIWDALQCLSKLVQERPSLRRPI